MSTENTELLGIMIVSFVSVGIPIFGVLTYLANVLMKLTKVLTTLEVSQTHQGEHLEEHGIRLNKHDEMLNDHCTEIKILKQRQAT